jgi:hypothetical protein
MIGLSSPASVFGWAIGIADAERIGASAKVQAANPINKKRFMKFCSLDRVVAISDNASTHALFPRTEPISFRVTRTQKRPRRGRRAEAARVRTSDRGGAIAGDKPDQPKFLHSRYELGRLHSLGLLQALILSLRIADSFGQHLAQLSLGLRGFALGWLPLCHAEYVGVRQAELNPAFEDNSRLLLSA